MQIHPQLRTLSPPTKAALAFLTLLPLYLISYHYQIHHPRRGDDDHSAIITASTLSTPLPSARDAFLRAWLSTHLLDPFDPAPLARHCNATSWTANLVFTLADANGGIGNVRGNVLDFVAAAVDAGADRLADVWGGGRAPFGHFFDEEWFVRALGDACPQMAIYREVERERLGRAMDGVFAPRSRRVDEDGGNTRAAGREALDAWLRANPEWGSARLMSGDAVVVNVGRSLWDVDTRSLPRGLRRNLGLLLQTRVDVRGLAAVVMWRLGERFGLRDLEARVPQGAFLGVHLRTESDARAAGWLEGGLGFENQTDGYIALAVRRRLKVVYVASGNATELERFREKAAANEPPLTVTSKFDLLEANEAAALRELTWDQQGLVDYEVLKRCSKFSGIVKSSFAFNIAMTRSQWLEDRGVVVDPYYVADAEDGVAFDDGLSRIVGRDAFHEHRIPRGMWP
jgi:hypothetical protein